MTKEPRTIRLADPSEDRARPESIAMVAVAAWGVGFVLMLGVARLLPSEHSGDRSAAAQIARAQLPGTEAEPTRTVSSTRGLGPPRGTDAHIVTPAPLAARAAGTGDVKSVAPGELEAKPEAPLEANAKAAPADRTAVMQPLAAAPVMASKPVEAPANTAPAPNAKPAAPPPITKPEPQPSAAAASDKPVSAAAASDALAPKKRGQKREFKQGVLAYLRCEGSERTHARFPCPRDPKLEEQVWHVLEALTTCDADLGTGTAELRLVLRKAAIESFEWKAPASGPSLNLRAVGKCSSAKLADLRTRLKATEGLVSFRFGLE